MLFAREVSKLSENQSEKRRVSSYSYVIGVEPFGSSLPRPWSVGRTEQQRTELFAQATDNGVFGLFNSSDNVQLSFFFPFLLSYTKWWDQSVVNSLPHPTPDGWYNFKTEYDLFTAVMKFSLTPMNQS